MVNEGASVSTDVRVRRTVSFLLLSTKAHKTSANRVELLLSHDIKSVRSVLMTVEIHITSCHGNSDTYLSF